MKNNKIDPRFEHAMRILGKQWNGLIIYFLLNGPGRSSTIQSTLGISGRVLSARLKELEKQKIVLRKVYPEYPVRVEYSLTEKGKSLKPMFKEIEEWSLKWVSLRERVVLENIND